MNSCIDCVHHLVVNDPDPNNQFFNDDVAILCALAKNTMMDKTASGNEIFEFKPIAVSCRPTNMRKETWTPIWCPLKDVANLAKQLQCIMQHNNKLLLRVKALESENETISAQLAELEQEIVDRQDSEDQTTAWLLEVIKREECAVAENYLLADSLCLEYHECVAALRRVKAPEEMLREIEWSIDESEHHLFNECGPER